MLEILSVTISEWYLSHFPETFTFGRPILNAKALILKFDELDNDLLTWD